MYLKKQTTNRLDRSNDFIQAKTDEEGKTKLELTNKTINELKK